MVPVEASEVPGGHVRDAGWVGRFGRAEGFVFGVTAGERAPYPILGGSGGGWLYTRYEQRGTFCEMGLVVACEHIQLR